MSRNLKSVQAFSGATAFTEGQLRWWIFDAANNGLEAAGAIVRVRRRVYIDVDKFDTWIDRQNQPRDRSASQAAA